MNKVYCHKEYCTSNKIQKILQNCNTTPFLEGNWYEIVRIDTIGDSIVIKIMGLLGTISFYKNDIHKGNDIELFSTFFYTKQEYNRIRNLDVLLNG